MTSPVLTASFGVTVIEAACLYTEMKPLLCLMMTTFPVFGVQSAKITLPLIVAFIGVFLGKAISTA